MSLGWVLVMLGGLCLAATNLYLAAMVGAINERRAPDQRIRVGPTGGTVMRRVTDAYRRECPDGRLHWAVRALMGVGFVLVLGGALRLTMLQ